MVDGSVLFWKYKPGGDWLFDFVDWVICKITDSNKVHTAIYVCGVVYESTVWFEPISLLGLKINWPHSGVKKLTLQELNTVPSAEYAGHRGPDVTVPPDAAKLMADYAEAQIQKKRPYNIPELAAMLVIWPTRPIWRALNWAPFTASVLGNFCSTFVEKCWLAGFCLVPLSDTNFTPPSELDGSKRLERQMQYP
jgi:hypothetical protein